MGRPVIPPPPARPTVARPAPPPAPVLGWQDRALTPGNWSFASDAHSSIARYGVTGAPPSFSIGCDKLIRSVTLGLPDPGAGPGPTSVTLRATTTAKAVPVAGGGRYTLAIGPRDPILDALAFSRGRFAVEMPQATLILPTWPEFSRVIEDCRG